MLLGCPGPPWLPFWLPGGLPGRFPGVGLAALRCLSPPGTPRELDFGLPGLKFLSDFIKQASNLRFLQCFVNSRASKPWFLQCFVNLQAFKPPSLQVSEPPSLQSPRRDSRSVNNSQAPPLVPPIFNVVRDAPEKKIKSTEIDAE